MLKEEEGKYIINTYNRQPDITLLITRGKGTLVWDENGKEYLDFVGGIAVNALGHLFPRLIEAAAEQMNKVIHTSNLYYSEPQIKLARCLVDNSVADRVFFGNSGAEANEAAIKLARKFSIQNSNVNKFEIITALDSFHGRTLATLTATGQEKYQRSFGPLPKGFRYARFNDLDSFKSQLSDFTCAIMVEPVQGEGGINVATLDFLAGLRRLCDENDILLIFDEIQCGMGRTGKLFAYEHYEAEPDIFTLAKALGGGLPIGAMLCREKLASGFSPGDHASTFGGNPVVCAVALAVMQEILQKDFLSDVTIKGDLFQAGLQSLGKIFPGVVLEVRGKGLMVAMELKEKGPAVLRSCQKKGLLVNCIGDNILRFLPPLNVKRDELDAALEILQSAFLEVFGNE
jgi:acetylornithine aminotransferase/acetylornithine/N-succinyldiaminopimelate aminotransferase